MKMTVLFDMDERKLSVDVLTSDTPFGRATAFALSDVFEEIEGLEMCISDLTAALHKIYRIADNHEPGPNDTTLADIIAACEAALGEDL